MPYTINVTYACCTMGRFDVVTSNIQRLSCILIGCISMTWYNIEFHLPIQSLICERFQVNACLFAATLCIDITAISHASLKGAQSLYFQLSNLCTVANTPFARSGHMVRSKLCWDTSCTVALSKQRHSYQSSPTFLCLESPAA